LELLSAIKKSSAAVLAAQLAPSQFLLFAEYLELKSLGEHNLTENRHGMRPNGIVLTFSPLSGF
jgi:hypothetical protein